MKHLLNLPCHVAARCLVRLLQGPLAKLHKVPLHRLAGTALGGFALICAASNVAAAPIPADKLPAVLVQKAYDASLGRQLQSFANDVRLARESGKLPASSYFTVEEVVPLKKDGSTMASLIPGTTEIREGFSFAALTGESALTKENYKAVLEVLFKDGNQKLKDRSLKIFDDYAKQGKNALIDDWFQRFNTFAKSIIHGSSEEYRRGLIASRSIAEYPGLPDSKKKLLADVTVNWPGNISS